MPKELELKVYTNKEIAQWFGITPNYFSKNKEKKLEELKAFADFEQVGNKQKKIKITHIYEPVYFKRGSEAFNKIKAQVDEVWDESGIDTCSRVSEKILMKNNYTLSIKESTVYNYTLRSRNDLYGKPFDQKGGTLGTCRYSWVKEDEEGGLRELTQEEEEIKQKLIKKYYGDATEKQILVQGMVEAGEITKEEAWDVLTKMTNMKGVGFYTFLQELQRILGCKIIKGTIVNRIQERSAF